MNVLILENNEAFSKLTSDKIARQHFIPYADGSNHFRIAIDRLFSSYGAKINADTLHWYISQYEKK
jgi:hypothetical protein